MAGAAEAGLHLEEDLEEGGVGDGEGGLAVGRGEGGEPTEDGGAGSGGGGGGGGGGGVEGDVGGEGVDKPVGVHGWRRHWSSDRRSVSGVRRWRRGVRRNASLFCFCAPLFLLVFSLELGELIPKNNSLYIFYLIIYIKY